MDEFRTKTKETNTFRFKSFADRINGIDIRQTTFYRIGHEYEDSEEGDDETQFAQTLRKWSVLNLTEEYNHFNKKCQGIVTLPQLVYKKQYVTEILMDALNTATVLSLEPVLEVLVAFAKDLRDEFYPHFDGFLGKLIELLNTREADRLEWTFRCLAILFKSLRPFLKRNIAVVLNRVMPLLDDDNNPEHVVNFASECFSFVARDVKDYEKFLLLTIKSATKHNSGLAGCGKLFFELVRGVNGSFHTVAPEFLRAVLGCFANTKYDQIVLLEIVTRMVGEMLEHIHIHNLSLFWQVTEETVTNMLKSPVLPDGALLSIVQLCRKCVEWKRGSAVVDVTQIVSLLVRIIDSVNERDVVAETMTIACIVLQSENVKVSQLDASRLISKLLKVKSENVYEEFVYNLCTHPQFEILILPDFLKYFEANPLIASLNLFVKINRKRTESGHQPRSNCITISKAETLKWLQSNIAGAELDEISKESLEPYLLSSMLYPQLASGDSVNIAALLKKKITKITFENGQEDFVLFTLYISIDSLLRLDASIDETFLQTLIDKLLKCDNTKLIMLRLLTNLLEYAKTNGRNIFTVEIFEKLHSPLCENLQATSHNLRLLTARIFNYFGDLPNASVYEIFYKTAEILPSVQTYRELLLHIQKLSPSGSFYGSLKSDSVKLDCLRFLLGLLYHNFKLVWEPVMKLLAEYAENLPVDDFWSIFRQKLNETKDTTTDLAGKVAFELKNNSLQNLYESLIKTEEKFDFTNYRSLLWKALSNFGQIIEVKNKEIVTFFLDFINCEYRRTDDANASTWNVLIETDVIVDFDDETDDVKPRSRSRKQHSAASTLAIMLEVFAKLVNPKQVYKEREICEIYLELLSGTNEQLQKLALDCLLRYKNKSHMPYKDHLYALIDDKKFKDELVNFKLDTESNMIEDDHRPDLMPILLRILYGKMRSKTANKYIGSQMRRSVVMKFLTGCRKDEIFWFLQTAFEGFQAILEADFEAIPDTVDTEFKLEAVWSPKNMRSALNLLDLIRKNFAGLMEKDFLIYMAKTILMVGSVCRNIFAAGEKVNEKYLAVFRNLRSQSLTCLMNFFDHFQDFEWTDGQLNAIFAVFIWPTLRKLPADCLHTPTPLCKLLEVWSRNQRYFKLLGKKDNDGTTPIGVAIELLVSDKPTKALRRAVLEMIQCVFALEKDDVHAGDVSIMAPYVPKILLRFEKVLNTKGLRRSFGKMELFILSRITEMNLTADVSDTLLKLLLPLATEKSQLLMSDESSLQFVATLKNLLLKVNSPEKHLRNLIPLFEKVSEVGTRKQLGKLLIDVAKKIKSRLPEFEQTSRIVNDLNAWDRKWIEQPDYDRRLGALRTIKEKMSQNEVDIDLGLFVIYNCFYFLHHDKDMGLRDSACLCMRSLAPKLLEKYASSPADINYLTDVLFSLIRRTLRDKNDLIRSEGILLLGEMSRNCRTAHPVLEDLNRLSSKDDPEVDFFENATHLQSHRHGRALLKFCAEAKECEKQPFATRTLTQFILPLATRYLLSEKFAAKHTLVDAAIETVGTVCRFLPWQQYHAILRYYLQKMKHCREYQKQCIRIIIGILDGFHFDLSNANQNVVTAKKMSRKAGSKQIEEKGKNDEVAKKEAEEQLSDNDLDSELDELHKSGADEEDADYIVPAKKLKPCPAASQLSKLSPSAANRVIQAIASNLIPSLNRSITALSTYESKHKLNRRRVNFEREEEESLRVPIALAVVKLLKKLPKQMLDANIQGVFLKVCAFLKSPVKSVRMLARDILKKIMQTIGTEYLSLLLSQLTVLLTRGFQVHVLSVTLYGVLDCLKDEFKPADIERALQYILKVTLNDIFGDASEEKEVDRIGAHTPEAKPTAKSFLSLQIVAQNLPENCLLDLLMPFKEYIYKTQSKKVVGKIQECFQKITSGLAENKNIPAENLLQFIYGMVSESIPDLIEQVQKLSEVEKVILARKRPDALLIPEAPKSRSGAVRKTARTNIRANAYVLIEFGLDLLHIILRRKKLEISEYLEPIVPLLKASLESPHVRIATLAIKCLTSILNAEIELKSLQENLDDIVKQIFVILHKYFSFGVMRKDDNFQLVKCAMKSIGWVIRKCDYYSLSDEYVTQLLFYIGQDVNDSDKQPVAFSLLKCFIDRHLYSKDLHEIMLKLCETAIISESDYARDESRSVLLSYTTEFYKEKKTESIFKFFIAQLNYEVLAGRMSAIKFLEVSVKKYPAEVLNRKAEVIYLALGTRIVNEDVPECRILIAECLELLLSRLNKTTRQKLFEITVLFFDGDKPAVREMAATLCTRFVQVEKEEFGTRTSCILPILSMKLGQNGPSTAGRFVKLNNGRADSEDSGIDQSLEAAESQRQSNQRAVDHEIIQIQNCLVKILTHCPQVLSDSTFDSTIDDIVYESQRLLAYDHEWVRLNSVKIINAILQTYSADILKNCLTRKIDTAEVKQFIYASPENDLKSLTLDLCAQMIPDETNEEIAAEISRSLLYIANLLRSIQNCDETIQLNLYWLFRRIRYIIQGEVAKAVYSVILRQSLFDWIDSMVTLLSNEELIGICPGMIASLIREIPDDDVTNVDKNLKQKAARVTNRIRKKIGDELYDKIRLEAQTKLMVKRANRKKVIAQEKILDPVRSAKRKSSRQERTKDAKRRKLEIWRGKADGTMRKKKRKNIEEMF